MKVALALLNFCALLQVASGDFNNFGKDIGGRAVQSKCEFEVEQGFNNGAVFWYTASCVPNSLFLMFTVYSDYQCTKLHPDGDSGSYKAPYVRTASEVPMGGKLLTCPGSRKSTVLTGAKDESEDQSLIRCPDAGVNMRGIDGEGKQHCIGGYEAKSAPPPPKEGADGSKSQTENMRSGQKNIDPDGFFKLLDKDGDGVMSKAEFHEWNGVEELFHATDTDKNGEVSRQEAQKLFDSLLEMEAKENAKGKEEQTKKKKKRKAPSIEM